MLFFNIFRVFVPIILVLVQPSLGFWRMLCGNYDGLYRIDPLVSPGNPSAHAHSIHGGSNFAFNTSYEDLMASPCTSCAVKEDNSAYWVPGLQFRYPNGTIQSVSQNGGIKAYYNLLPVNFQGIKAFPPGFRMLAGDSKLREFPWATPEPPKSLWAGAELSQAALRQKALGFNCLHYASAPEGTLDRHNMPSKAFLDENCHSGLRLEIVFPSCWNGKDLDSPDHRSHVAYSSLVLDGTCPADFPVRFSTLLYETIWDTHLFKGIDGEFVLSNGDTTGYGNHADFINGWNVDTLQAAIQQCTNGSGNIQDCPVFTIQEQSCGKFTPPKVLMAENCAGPRQGLCMEEGNAPAMAAPVIAAPAIAAPAIAAPAIAAPAIVAPAIVAPAIAAPAVVSPPAVTPPAIAPSVAIVIVEETMFETVTVNKRSTPNRRHVHNRHGH